MVMDSTRHELIVSTSPQVTAPLGELIACLDWPVLLQASPQRLSRELLLRDLEVALFWFDDQRHVAATVELLAGLGVWRPNVRRMAVNYQLGEAVERAVRSAGVHFYLAADGNICALVNGSLSDLAGSGNRFAPRVSAGSLSLASQATVLDWPQNRLHSGAGP